MYRDCSSKKETFVVYLETLGDYNDFVSRFASLLYRAADFGYVKVGRFEKYSGRSWEVHRIFWNQQDYQDMVKAATYATISQGPTFVEFV